MRQMLVITVEELYEKLDNRSFTVDDVDAVFYGYSHTKMVIATKESIEGDLIDFAEFLNFVKILSGILILIKSGDLPEQFVIERTIVEE